MMSVEVSTVEPNAVSAEREEKPRKFVGEAEHSDREDGEEVKRVKEREREMERKKEKGQR